MNTYRYEILKLAEDCYCVSEADGPSALATGDYTTLDAAQGAIEHCAGRPLDFQRDTVNTDGETWCDCWTTEFSK